MRELYDRLIREGEAGIQRLIDERMQEGVQLDFKQKGDPRKGIFEANDKKILAKAVSGFANSAGGLLVWGVNAEKGPDDVDCAQPPAAPIAQIELFLSQAMTFIGQLIQPRHDGIHLHVVPSAAAAGSGYLLIYVERSERRPHRSEASGQKQYFRRAGDSFFEMEHYDIEDAFRRTPAPELNLVFLPEAPVDMIDTYTVYRTLGLHNTSDYIAKYPYMILFNLSNFSIELEGLRGDRQHGLKHAQLQTSHQFLGGADDVVHPGSILQVAKFKTVFSKRGEVWMSGLDRIESVMARFSFKIGCEGMRALSDQREFLAAKGHMPPP